MAGIKGARMVDGGLQRRLAQKRWTDSRAQIGKHTDTHVAIPHQPELFCLSSGFRPDACFD